MTATLSGLSIGSFDIEPAFSGSYLTRYDARYTGEGDNTDISITKYSQSASVSLKLVYSDGTDFPGTGGYVELRHMIGVGYFILVNLSEGGDDAYLAITVTDTDQNTVRYMVRLIHEVE